MTRYVGTAATDPMYELGEGVLWDEREGVLRWVDILSGRLLRGRLHEGRVVDATGVDLGQTAGAVALAEDGGLLVAGARGLIAISPTGKVSRGPDVLGDRRGVRFNDASVDPQGRLVAGTLALREETGTEELLRISPDGSVETLRTGLGMSNGVAFSPDGATIYHVDTLAGTVSRHSYGPGDFDDDEPWRIVLDGFAHFPDGLTVSADGSLWIALWGGASVQRHAPTGELVGVVELPAAQASCPAFVGAGLDTLAITTAWEGMTERRDQSGALFLADVDAVGLPSPRWRGSTTDPYWHDTKEHQL